MRVSVDRSRCEAHGQCNMIDDQLFTLDDEGYSDIGTGRPVPDDLTDNADQGIYNCPVNALYIEKD